MRDLTILNIRILILLSLLLCSINEVSAQQYPGAYGQLYFTKEAADQSFRDKNAYDQKNAAEDAKLNAQNNQLRNNISGKLTENSGKIQPQLQAMIDMLTNCRPEILKICTGGGPGLDWLIESTKMQKNHPSEYVNWTTSHMPPATSLQCVQNALDKCQCCSKFSGGKGNALQTGTQQAQYDQGTADLNTMGQSINTGLQKAGEKQTQEMAKDNQQILKKFNNSGTYTKTAKPELNASALGDDDDDKPVAQKPADNNKKFMDSVRAKQMIYDDAKEEYRNSMESKAARLNKTDMTCKDGVYVSDDVSNAPRSEFHSKYSIRHEAYWSAWIQLTNDVKIRYSKKVVCRPSAAEILAPGYDVGLNLAADIGGNIHRYAMEDAFDYGFIQLWNTSSKTIDAKIKYTTETVDLRTKESVPYESSETLYLEPNQLQDEDLGNWYIGCRLLRVVIEDYCVKSGYY